MKRKKYVIGIDLGGTNAKVAVVDLSGKLHRKKIFSTKEFPTKDKLINALTSHIKDIIQEHNITKRNILGIGIGTPGLVDSKRGIIHYLVNIKGFKEVPLKRIIENKLKIPTFIDNDVNIMSLGELYYGSGKGVRNIVCLTLGTGVGGGIIIEGKLYRGATLSAGEIGHTTINEDGARCNCGNNGCMEAYAGNVYIVKDAISKLKKNKKSLMLKLADGKFSNITPKIISEAAKKGDSLAQNILKDVGGHIGVALASVINIINPERIIIGGGVANAGSILFDAIRATVDKRAMKVPAKAVKIVKAKLGEDAGLMGAVALVKEGLKS